MEKNIKITGVKKAVGTYKRANSGGPYHDNYGVIRVDRNTGEVWCDEYASSNSWTVYNDKAIADVCTYPKPVNMENVRTTAERMCREWAEIH